MVVANSLWYSPLTSMTLSRHDVHIWRVFLDQPEECVRQLAVTLSSDEEARASQFYFERDRRRYIASRGFLRRILSYYLCIEPGQLRFCYGEYGKPALAELSDAGSLCFSLSHSHEFAAYAVTCGREVGIDIECMRHISEMEQLVERFFCPSEIATFYALDANERYEAFFRGWTRKEAYLKAVGTGLRRLPNRVEVTLFKEPARLIGVEGGIQEVLRWSLRDLELAPGYSAALSVAGDDYQLAYWQ